MASPRRSSRVRVWLLKMIPLPICNCVIFRLSPRAEPPAAGPMLIRMPWLHCYRLDGQDGVGMSTDYSSTM